MRQLIPRRTNWRSKTVLCQNLFEEIIRSAVPIDLRALGYLQRSPLAIELYVWLTYRMSYLRKPTVISWEGLQDQFGADYGRLRDYRRKALAHLQSVLRVYRVVLVSQTANGLRLYPSAPDVPGTRPLS